jgi:predicted RND superfamily exporter protein
LDAKASLRPVYARVVSEVGEPHPDAGPTSLDSVHGSAFFAGWARFVLRHRLVLLAATLAVTGWTGWVAWTELRADTSDESFLAAGDPSTTVLHEVRREFGDDALFQLLVGGDVFTHAYLERLRRLHDAVGAIALEPEPGDAASAAPAPVARPAQPAPGGDGWEGFEDSAPEGDDGWGGESGGSIVDELISLINVRQTRARDDGLRVEGLLARWPAADELAALKRRVLADRTLVGQVVDVDGTHSVLVLRTRKLGDQETARLHERLESIARQHSQAGFEVQVSGGPAVSAAMRRLMLHDARLSMALSSIVMLLITGFIFRHPIGLLGPATVVWQAEIWTLGTMALSDTPMTMVTTVLPAFIGCVGLGDAIHILSVYRVSRGRGMPNEAAIIHTLATTGLPVLLTTLTTAMGLLSFRFASLQAIRDMGSFGALGVTGALINSLIFLPILLSFNHRSLLGMRAAQGADWLDRLLARFERLSAPTPLPSGAVSRRPAFRVLAGCALVSVLALVGLTRLRVYHDGLDWFPDDDPTRQAVRALEQSVGGTANLALLLEAREGHSLREREAVVAIERLERHILAYDDGHGPGDAVRNAISLLDPLRESWRAMHGDDPKFYAIPDTEQGVRDMFLLFESASPDQLQRLMTVDMQRSLLTVRVKWRDAHSYLPLVAHIDAGIEQHLQGVVDAQPTGSVYVAVSIVNRLLSDLLNSFSSAALVITALMMFLVRDLKMGLLSMLPNLLPIAMVMGYMGYVGIVLDTSTLMLGSIAIGIVVDDTIHFLHQFKSHYDAHGQVEAAVKHAFTHSGRAMTLTSVLLVAGFACVTAGDMLSSRLFGYLLGLTAVAALLADLTLTPALLRVAYRDRA